MTKPTSKPKTAPKSKPAKAAPPALKVNRHAWDKPSVMDFICNRLASSSASMYTILAEGCDGEPLPDYTTIAKWLRNDEALSQQYARAKEDQADFMADELIEIADNSTGDHNRDRLRLDARKWVAAKLKPRRYGDKLDLNHGGQPTNPVKITHDIGPEAAADAYKDMLG